jgi:hypothetical protein
MSIVAIHDFWKLAVASRLLSPSDCQELAAAFAALKGVTRQANTRSLVEWLVANGTLSRYQASTLASGRPGPFVFDDFVVTERIETGRFARFFRAQYNDNQNVLLVFAAQLTGAPDPNLGVGVRAGAAMAVKSPHVSRVYRAVANAGQPFVAVQDLQGQTLREYLADQKSSLETAYRIGFHAALGLAAMHEKKVLHGSLCPENILIEPSGTAVLLQFPLAQYATPDQHSNLRLADYAAPELTDASQPAHELTDLYALGCVLYELIAGRPPFPGPTIEQKQRRHRTEIAQRLDKIVPEVPEELAGLVAEMIAKEPMLRCQTASHVVHVLAPFASGSQPRAAKPPADKADPVPTPDERTSPAAAGAAHPPDEPAWEAPILAADVARTPSAKPARRRFSDTALIGGGVGLVLASAIVIAGFVLRGHDVTATRPQPGTNPEEAVANAESTAVSTEEGSIAATAEQTSAAGPPDAQASAKAAIVEVEDDGQTLWSSPTAGAPLEFELMPSGAQVLMVLRPAELLESSEGAKLLDALGPAGTWAESQLRSILGVELSDVEQLTIAFYPDDSGAPQAAFVMRLRQAIPAATLLRAWGQPAPAEQRSKKFFRGAHLAYYLPEGKQGRTAAIAPVEAMQTMLEVDGPPLLRKGIERLLRSSDSARHFSLLFAPSYLLTDGQGLWAGDLEKLRDPLAQFLGENIQAVLVSAHLGDELFLEWRELGPADQRPQDLAQLTRARLEKISAQVENYVATLQPLAYGRLVVNRFPRMVQLLSDFTRSGVEDQQSVLRCYLPGNAAHNLLLGAELTLLEQPAIGGAAADRPRPAPRRAGAAAALEKKISLSFPRDTLERCLEMFAKEIDTKVVILGSDLQLEGITKNQSFPLDERDRPAAAVLRRVLSLANPDGKLVYVIRRQEGGAEAIFITTRSAATKRGDPLPAEFAPKSSPE